MTDTFRLEDRIPYVGDKAFPWATEVRGTETDHQFGRPDGRYWMYHRGFHLTFENGFTISIQWGNYNYCEHYVASRDSKPQAESHDAEIAVWDRHGTWYQCGDYDDVLGYLTTDQVLAWIEKVSNFDSDLLVGRKDDG